eukprot:m.503395 g.503395  ORF g.503395 m.503395 type:complete len:275 (-) comp57346_c0_seq9:114-938(-)
MSGEAQLPSPGGFTFDLVRRNAMLEQTGLKAPKPVKTGTTIVGVIFKDGVVLGADTRATEGPMVADKNCEKIHYIAPNIYCCGAGTAADTQQVTDLISSKLELHRLRTERGSRVATACRMLKQFLFKYQGQISAALVLGGVDVTGPCLYSVAPHGSTDKLPFVTMGSGSIAAISVFEDRFKLNMELDEAKLLVRDAISAGIFNDLGSGSNVDLCVITARGVDYLRSYEVGNVKPQIHNEYRFRPGSTAVLTTTVSKIVVTEEVVETAGAMQTSS